MLGVEVVCLLENCATVECSPCGAHILLVPFKHIAAPVFLSFFCEKDGARSELDEMTFHRFNATFTQSLFICA